MITIGSETIQIGERMQINWGGEAVNTCTRMKLTGTAILYSEDKQRELKPKGIVIPRIPVYVTFLVSLRIEYSIQTILRVNGII